jgi:hypothetical protein
MTPTVVTLIKHNVDVSYVFAFTEEENKGCEKTAEKTEYDVRESHPFPLVWITSEKTALDYYLMQEKQVYPPIFSPPPEA